MATIEEIIAIINNNPKQISDMSDEELTTTLAPCLALEPKPLPKPLAEQVLEQMKDEDDDDNPIKLNRPKKTKKEKVKSALTDYEKTMKELGIEP